MRNQSPQLIAGGDIYPHRFVKASSSADNTVLQATANSEIIGVSGVGTKDAPGVTGNTYAGASGDPIELFGLGDICLIEVGSGGVVRDDYLKADADGKCVTISGTGGNQKIGAIALESASAGELVRVQVIFMIDFAKVTQTALTDTATVTAAQLLTRVLDGTPTAAATYTLPTAALLVAGMPGVRVGDSFDFVINNKSAGANTITVAAGTGGTADGTLTVAQNVIRAFKVIVTNVTASSEAYFVYGIG